jgi:hypothetical protein
MSTDAAPRRTVPTNPRALAALIADEHVPDLFPALVAQLGGDRDAAATLWWQAADLLEQHYPIPRRAVNRPPLMFLTSPRGVPCDDRLGDLS